ncbi:MAG: ferritin family protein [Candidatus Omnitrophica bacterium]|nr:ferritin family protein [Candidatus Omnitrophota bacterium]
MAKFTNGLSSISDDEVLKLAMNLEEEGYDFYSGCIKNTRNEKAKRLFSRLAAMEKKHFAVFSRLHSRIAKKRGVFATDEDALVKSYINALIDTGVFKKGVCPVITLDKDSVLNALEFAKTIEKDSVLFYTELEELARSEETKNILRAVVKQEKKHVIDIDQFIKKEFLS